MKLVLRIIKRYCFFEVKNGTFKKSSLEMDYFFDILSEIIIIGKRIVNYRYKRQYYNNKR